MNANGFIGIFAFTAIWVLSRLFSSWLVRLSYTSAGETIRSVEKRYDSMKRGLVPKKKEIDWLSEVSPRPLTTKFLYFLFYFVTSLPLLGICVSVINIFVPALDMIVTRMLNVFFFIPFVSVLGWLLINDPIEYAMKKKDRKNRRK